MTNEITRYDAMLDDLRARLRAEYEMSEELKHEFPEAEDYVAWSLTVAERNAGVLSTWKSNFEATDNLAAFKAAEAADLAVLRLARGLAS